MVSNSLKIFLKNGFCFEMIYVEGGEFLMGSEEYNDEKPIHPVALSNYYIGKYLVTQGLWQAVMQSNPSYFVGADRPVETVSWDEVQTFIDRLNKATEKSFRLPTEAEWEFAARGGKKSHDFKYSGSNKLQEVGWYDENSYGETKPVGLKFSNELGLYDMSGNVWEWCKDWYDSDYYSECSKVGLVTDPPGPDQGVNRVLRGGNYFNNAENCRVTNRNNNHPDNRFNNDGFRLVLPDQLTGKPDGFH